MQKRSWVYEAFDIEANNFKCKHCGRKLKRPTHGILINWGTSDLWHHLRRRHREIFFDLKSRPKESRPTFDYAQIFAGMPKDALDLILSVRNVNGGEVRKILENQRILSSFYF